MSGTYLLKIPTEGKQTIEGKTSELFLTGWSVANHNTIPLIIEQQWL